MSFSWDELEDNSNITLNVTNKELEIILICIGNIDEKAIDDYDLDRIDTYNLYSRIKEISKSISYFKGKLI